MDNYRKQWIETMHDYIEILKLVDNPLVDEETKHNVLNENYEKIQKVSSLGMINAMELDTIHDVLYQKWWFKLFTKLKL